MSISRLFGLLCFLAFHDTLIPQFVMLSGFSTLSPLPMSVTYLRYKRVPYQKAGSGMIFNKLISSLYFCNNGGMELGSIRHLNKCSFRNIDGKLSKCNNVRVVR